MLEILSGGEAEETAAAVGVDEVLGSGGGGGVGDVINKGREDEGVVLEEVAGEEGEGDVAYGFGGDFFIIGEDALVSVAEEEGGAFLKGLGCGVGASAVEGEFFVDGLGGYGALLDVDDHAPAGMVLESDVADLAVAGLIEVRGDF